MNLRMLNLFLICGMLVTLLAHAIMGSMQLMGADAGAMKPLAWAGIGFVAAHVIVTSILTVESLRARALSGAGYFKDNALFWTRRLSGFLILIPLVMHLLIFSGDHTGEAFRLTVFTTGKMISQILLVVAIALHVLTNIRPALISMGVRNGRAVRVDALLVLTLLLLLFAVGFVIYYLRWMYV